jgi:hypothetical protein
VSRIERVWQRGRRALGLPPRYVAHRLYEESLRSTRRPWSHVRPSLLTEGRLLRLARCPSVDALWERQLGEPFFFDPGRRAEIVESFRRRFPDAAGEIARRAERVLDHEFDLLGSGPRALGSPLPWHEDFKTGKRWTNQYWRTIEYNELDQPSDVKVPWELSRCQHFTTLGQAYWLTGDEKYAREYVAEITDWLQANPWAHSVNWACAMDVALRAMSWIWGFYFFGRSQACADPAFRFALLKALYLHGEFVADNVERANINGNHYLTDGVGLVFLGTFFREWADGPGWLRAGREIVVPEIFNQVYEDGVDFEMSTAYHRLVFEGFCASYVLLRHAAAPPPAEAWQRLERMCEFVQAYVKPDGSIPLIGDADDGRMQQLGIQSISEHRYLLSTGAVLFSRSDFKASATRFWDETFWLLGPESAAAFDALPEVPLPQQSRAFPHGGYYVLRSPDAHAMVDCGEVGMRGHGGHGHNDILSFELFLNGINVVSDCGSYLYTASREWRNHFRSTAFHNVVQVDREEANRFVSPDHLWTMHYDARPVDPQWWTSDDVDLFAGGHSGYERLPQAVQVRRLVALDRRAPRVLVIDTIEGAGAHHLHWRFHLDPRVVVERRDGDVCLRHRDREVWLMPVDGDSVVEIVPGWVSPSYGVKHPTSTVSCVAETALPVTRTWLFAERLLPQPERHEYVERLKSLAVPYASNSPQ